MQKTYISYDDIFDMVIKDEEFTVIDYDTNADVTCSVLRRIIFNREKGNSNNSFSNILHSIIKCGSLNILLQFMNAKARSKLQEKTC